MFFHRLFNGDRCIPRSFSDSCHAMKGTSAQYEGDEINRRGSVAGKMKTSLSLCRSQCKSAAREAVAADGGTEIQLNCRS